MKDLKQKTLALWRRQAMERQAFLLEAGLPEAEATDIIAKEVLADAAASNEAEVMANQLCRLLALKDEAAIRRTIYAGLMGFAARQSARHFQQASVRMEILTLNAQEKTP